MAKKFSVPRRIYTFIILFKSRGCEALKQALEIIDDSLAIPAASFAQPLSVVLAQEVHLAHGLLSFLKIYYGFEKHKFHNSGPTF